MLDADTICIVGKVRQKPPWRRTHQVLTVRCITATPKDMDPHWWLVSGLFVCCCDLFNQHIVYYCKRGLDPPNPHPLTYYFMYIIYFRAYFYSPGEAPSGSQGENKEMQSFFLFFFLFFVMNYKKGFLILKDSAWCCCHCCTRFFFVAFSSLRERERERERSNESGLFCLFVFLL